MIWLLRWFQQETGREVQPYVDALYDHAMKFGYDRSGLLVDEILVGRTPTPSYTPNLAYDRGDQGKCH